MKRLKHWTAWGAVCACALGLAILPEASAQAPPLPGAPEFLARDVANARLLVHKLRTEADPVSAFVWSRLPAATRQLLADHATPPTLRLSALLDGLNSLLRGPSIYEPARFAGVALSPRTLELAGRAPQGPPLAQLNRMLLEDAYPLEMRQSLPPSLAPPEGAGVSTDQPDSVCEVDGLGSTLRFTATGEGTAQAALTAGEPPR